MYSEIASNKHKTVFIFGLFLILVTGMSWIFSGFMKEPAITPFVLGAALIYAVISYYGSSKIALAMNAAKEVQKKDNPRLYRMVENLAITEGIPTPKVYIMQDPALNAFATGRNPQNGTVCVTSGLLEAMNDQELQGVLAHELGHIRNYDIRVSLAAFALVAVISLMADIMLRMTWFRDNDDDSGAGQLFFILGIVAAILAPFAALLIQLAISRKREFLADATGALTTRYPEGLASALEKIRDKGSVVKKQNTSTAHFFFANPLKKANISNFFSTHPPIEERIKRLQTMGTHL
jgi:heat shock protein HtpX